ncbi:MAG: hypothetical protein ACSHXI_18755 [Hoeflea sp.]|uniref:hypothetical protein n=1 Tax=Hoeflea sp. TaxID=1940281 RepID=UPI003EF93CB5
MPVDTNLLFQPLELPCGAILKNRIAKSGGCVDVVGLARALVLDPALAKNRQAGRVSDPVFPRFGSPPEGGITACYTMRLTELGQGRETDHMPDIETAITNYDTRDTKRIALWNDRFPL